MANSGKMRSASDATKRSSVSKLLVKSTRSQKTSSSAKGRDNLGFAPGLGPRAGEMDGARLSVQEVDQRCAQWNAAVAGGKSTVNESVERVKKPSDIGHRAAVTKVLDEAPFAAGRTGRNEGHAAPGRAVSKFGSTTALESLTCGLSPESPIYEELDFKCSSFRDLNSDPERRLESPDTSNSSADLSLPRHGLPFSMRHARHRSHNAIPSCGVRIAELRASRKYEGARTSPSSVSSSSSSTSQPFVKTTNSSSDRIHSPRSSDSNLSLRKDSMSPDTLLQVQSQHEKHRSSLDLNVTYVEYFDETNPVSTVAPPAALLSPNPRDSVASSASLSSCSSSIPSEAEPQTLSSVSLPTAAQTDFTRSGRYTTATGATNSHAKGRQSIKGAAAAAWAMPGVQVVPSVPGANCRSSQRNADAGSSRIGAVKNVIVGDKAKSVLRSNSGPTEGFSPDLQPDGEGGLEKETGILCMEVTDAASSSFGPHRPISRFLSEPDNSSDCSAVSLSSSPTSTDTLIDSVPSNTSLAEDTPNNDLASPEATDDDNKHSNSARHLHAKPGQLTELPKCHAVNKRPSQLLGPAVIQGQAQRRPVKMADFNSSAEANQSPLSCLNKREALSKAPNPQIGQPNSSSKSIIQRLEMFGRSTEWKGGKSHSGRLPKSSSVDLPKQIASAPNSSSKTSKTKNTAVGVLPCSTAVQQIHSHSQRGRAAVIPVKSTVRRAQSSDSHTPSARNNVSLALSKVNNHNCAMRNPDLGTEESVCSVGPSKDAKALSPTSVAASLSHGTPRFARSNSSPVCSNRLRQFSPAGEVTCRPEKSSAKNSSSSGDSSVPGFRLQQQKLQPLSPIAERSTQQRSSVSSSVTPTANGSNNSGNTSRGNASPRIVPFTSAKGVPLPTYRNLSFSQRATSMSKIPTGKSSSPISAVTPKNAEVERQTVVQTDCRMDKAMLADRSLLQMNETISRSHTSIYERSTREPSALREATEKQRFNSCSCQTLNTCADPSKAGFLKHVEGHINQTPDSSGRKLNNKTSVKLRDVEVNVDPDPPPPPPPCPSGQTPENASVSRMDEASEAKLKPVSSGEPPKTTFLRKLRTPTDFASGRKSETGGDRNSFRSAVVRGDSGASALNNNSTSESKLNSAKDSSSASTSVFRQLQQMKHVKPYASASHRIADKFTRSRRSEEVDSCCHLNTATGHVDNHAVTCQEVAKDGDTADRHPSNAAAAASASSLTPACMNSCSADSAGESQNGVNDNFALSNSSSPEVAVIGDKNAQTLSCVDGPCRDNEDICDPNLIDDRLDDNTESFEVKQSLSTGDDFVEAAEDPSAEVAADGISLSESRTDDCASGKQFVGDQPFSLPLQRPNVSDGDESQCVAPAAEERFDSVRTLAATDVPRRRQKEPSKQDHGSQTTLSDINLIGDGIILKPTNRNSLLLIEPENSIRDIDKFVVTYESDNIIVLERADSISTSVTSSRDSRGECVLDMTTAGHDSIVSTSMHGDIVRKFGKDNTMSTSRSADIKAITSPKTETGTIPLSESGYDSWKSQSSKSSSRLLKLSESDVYAIPSTNLTFGRLSETEMSDESCFMYKDNRNYLADERIRSYRERNACIDDLFGSVDKMNSRTIIADESQQLGDDEEEEHGLMQICDSEGSRLSSNIDREKPSTAGSRGCSKEPVPQTSAGEERFVGFSYSFSSFPSSSSSLLETLDGINLSRTGSDERLTTLEKPWNRRSSVDRPRSGEFVDQNDQADDLAFGSWTELNPNPAAYHSRDYHNRIYKLDFGTGDSAEMIINQDDPDLCPDDRPSKQQQQQQRLDGVLAAAKHRSSSHAHSKVSSFTADSQLQSINYLHNSKSGPLQRTATDSGDFSPFAETHGTHSKTFPIAIKKACVECFQAQEAQTIAENCQVFAKTHKLRQRPEKETFYENMCDAMLESLDPDLSDSDNSPHSSLIAENSAKFDYSNSAVTVESGTRSTPSDKCSEIKLKSEDQRINLSSSQEFSDRSVKPHNKSDEGVSRPIKPTLTSSHTIESAAGFQTISSDAKMAPEIKLWKISTDNAESGNQSKNPANVLSQCRPNPSVVEDKHLATDGPLNIGVDLLWISQYCIDEQKYRVDAQNKLTVVPEEVVIDNRSERVSRVMAVSPGHDISRNSDNATCDTDCVAAESSVNVNSRSSPEVSLPTPPTKEGGKSSTNILTRYLPALRRKSSKDRYSTHDAAAAAVGRSDMCTVSRNSAPISLDGGRRESAERHQEPRSVKEVIRQFEDKTAATLAVNSVDPAKCVTAAPVLAQEQKGKKSKFTKKPN